jgi:hypothetical protein
MTKGRGLGVAAAFLLLTTPLAACGRLPRLQDYPTLPLAQTSFLYASDGSLITQLHAEQNRVVLSYNQMPQSIRDATVAIEDKRFYEHHGVDLRAIVRAAYDNAESGQTIEGGSTLTQQLVKNLYTGDERTFLRKFDEAVLAWQLEDEMSKDQILTEYLNTVYFGQGAYGVQAAARTFFEQNFAPVRIARLGEAEGFLTGYYEPIVQGSRFPNPEFHVPLYRRPRDILVAIDGQLAGRTWAAGADFTLADCAAAPSLFYADWTHRISEAYPVLRAYRARLLARPSFARAVEEARPFRPLFPLGAPDRD